MASLFWANVINLYQPPGIERSELEKIVNLSYIPLLAIFEKNPKYSMTLNLPGSTVDLLIRTGFGTIINTIAALAENGQVDFTVTPTYQPVIPLMAEDDIDRQIEAHNKICRRYFGIYYRPAGLFSPYQAYSPKVTKTGARFALKWVVINDSSINSNNHSALYMDKSAGGILILPANSELSRQLNGAFNARNLPRSATEFIQSVSKQTANDRYLITIADAASFGYLHAGRNGLLGALYKDPKLRPVSVTQLRRFIKRKEFARPVDSSSETINQGGRNKRPFLAWDDSKSPVQQTLWKIFSIAVSEIKNAGAKGDPQYARAREMMDAASAGINWIMTAAKPWWDPKYALKVADDLAIAVFVLLSSPLKVKEEAIALRQRIYDQIEQFEKSGDITRSQKEYLRANNIPPDRFFKK